MIGEEGEKMDASKFKKDTFSERMENDVKGKYCFVMVYTKFIPYCRHGYCIMISKVTTDKYNSRIICNTF